MNLTVAYRTRSAIVDDGSGGLAVTLAADLRRDRVSFDAAIRDPLRFRAAVAAFQDAVLGNPSSRRPPSASAPAGPEGADLASQYRKQARRYRAARRAYADRRMLDQDDPGPWRALMPTDPIVTVAPDALILEAFGADESTYARLTIARGAFADEADVRCGTSGVDWSWKFRDDFQALRGDRRARLRLDSIGAGDGRREEEVDLPGRWLRGVLRLQSALSLPMRRVSVGVEGLYNVLAILARRRAAKGPRAIRFELTPGRPATLVLEPWGVRVASHGRPDDGPGPATIRVWGRDRLRAFARALPEVDDAEVWLLGTGLPGVWSARMGDYRLAIGLSGGPGSDLSGPGPMAEPGRYLTARVAAGLAGGPARTLAGMAGMVGGVEAEVLAALNRLAGQGRVAHDPAVGLYRWRPMTAEPLDDARLGPEDPEAVAAREIARTRSVRVDRDEAGPDGARSIEGRVLDRPATLAVDADGRVLRARCTCSHRPAGGLRVDPCRHLLALREVARHATSPG